MKNYNAFHLVFEEEKTVEIRRMPHRLQDAENRLHDFKELHRGG